MGVRPAHLVPGQTIDSGLLDNLLGENGDQEAYLIVVERGHWCSACRKHLAQMTDQWDEFELLPISVMVMAHESTLDAELKAYPFPVLADPDLVFANRLGLVHTDEYGMTTVRPSMILTTSSGEILFSYVGDDSRDRPTVSALLLALESLLVR